jgi:hypothetical protein
MQGDLANVDVSSLYYRTEPCGKYLNLRRRK